jgi:hypothetical protein
MRYGIVTIVAVLLAVPQPLLAQNSWIYSSHLEGPETAPAALDPTTGDVIVGESISVSRIDANGQRKFRKGYYYGPDSIQAVYVDQKGDIYIAGNSYSNGLTTVGAYQARPLPGNDRAGFVMKLSPDGTITAATMFGGKSTIAKAVSADSDGNIIACGFTAVADFPTTSGSYKSTATGPYAAFCMVVSRDAKTILASTLFGPDETLNQNLGPVAMSLEADGNILVAGRTMAPSFPVVNGFAIEDRRRVLFRTESNATDWQTIDNGALATLKNISFDHQDSNRMWAATASGVIRSEDGGHAWGSMNTIGVNNTDSIYVHPLNAAFMIHVSAGGNVFGSQDSGRTWSTIAASSTLSLVIPLGANIDKVLPDFSEAGTFLIHRANNDAFNGIFRVRLTAGETTRLSPTGATGLIARA